MPDRTCLKSYCYLVGLLPSICELFVGWAKMDHVGAIIGHRLLLWDCEWGVFVAISYLFYLFVRNVRNFPIISGFSVFNPI